eukprot:7107275-Prymnesium_polylepis.1
MTLRKRRRSRVARAARTGLDAPCEFLSFFRKAHGLSREGAVFADARRIGRSGGVGDRGSG